MVLWQNVSENSLRMKLATRKTDSKLDLRSVPSTISKFIELLAHRAAVTLQLLRVDIMFSCFFQSVNFSHILLCWERLSDFSALTSNFLTRKSRNLYWETWIRHQSAWSTTRLTTRVTWAKNHQCYQNDMQLFPVERVSLANTFAICYRPSVCLSVICRLSVTFVRPTQAIEIFGNLSTFYAIWYTVIFR